MQETRLRSASFTCNVLELLTFLLDHEDLIVDLLAQQDRMQVVEKGLQMLRSVTERDDYGDTMPGDAVCGTTRTTCLHLHE